MIPESFDAVLLTLGFFIPGFVWSSVLSMFVPRRSSTDQARFWECFALSCLNNGLWSWAILMIVTSGFWNQHPNWSALLFMGIIFVSPAALGFLSGVLQQRQSVARLLARLGFRTIHPAPTAWDWHFSRGSPYWVLVRLKDGSRVFGLFRYSSFAGSDPQNRDLYLERTFRPLETGEWAPVEDTAGILIMADQIATIEFRKLEEANDGEPDSTNAP